MTVELFNTPSENEFPYRDIFIDRKIATDADERVAISVHRTNGAKLRFCASVLAAANLPFGALMAASSDVPMIEQSLGVSIITRDGTPLAANIYRPAGRGRFGTVVSITPYGRNNDLHATGRRFAQHGYAFVSVDARGRFDSGGQWDPFDARHGDDGYDAVEWAAAQSWSTGRVGMSGGSYSGWVQWWTATKAPPHLVAIAPISAPPDPFAHAPYQDGVLRGGWFVDWVALMAGRTNQTYSDDASGGWSARRNSDLQRLPYIALNRYRGIEGAPWWERWYRANLSGSPYWQAVSYQTAARYRQVRVPSLSVTGWFDVVHAGSPANFMGVRQYGANEARHGAYLVIGPWDHDLNRRVTEGFDYGPAASIDTERLLFRWFDEHLKGSRNGVREEPRVRLFLMGANEWRAYQDWPVAGTHFTAFNLSPDGQLSTETARRGSRAYRYNPLNPTLDASSASADRSVSCTRASSPMADRLIYQTAPLSHDVDIIGPIQATLFAATSVPDTDWMVRLLDVSPDGCTRLLADGAMRARSRDPALGGSPNPARLSQIVPKRVYEYRIRFWRGTANRFAAGHRIRVEISSSWFPTYLPNLNSGDDNLAMVTANRAKPATQTIFHGPLLPSHILLPIVPMSRQSEARKLFP